jgi:hypothetical protein
MTSPEPAPITATPRGLGLGRVVLSIGVPLIALASGYLGAHLALRPVVAALATRPPVLILDLAQAVRGLAPAQVDAVIARHRAIAHQLAQGGVLVLDAQAVLDAPPTLVLPAQGQERVQ